MTTVHRRKINLNFFRVTPICPSANLTAPNCLLQIVLRPNVAEPHHMQVEFQNP